MKSLDEFFEHSRQVAKAKFDADGEFIATFFLEAPLGIVVVPAPWRDRDEKMLAVAAAKAAAKMLGATRVVVVVEAWMVQRKVGTDMSGLVPSKEADRIEVVWVTGQSSVVGERERAGFHRIERDAAGKAKTGEWTAQEGTGHSIFDGIVGGGILQ